MERDESRVSAQDESGLANRAREVKDRVKESAREFAQTAGEKAERARSSVAQGLESFGSGIREKGSSTSAAVGRKIEAAGAYLREHDFREMGQSLKEIVQKHPTPAIFIGIGLGFVLARAMRRG
jgi:ElaB/YqjD/DUF883 family membrane-anchored ribosome-binding protein